MSFLKAKRKVDDEHRLFQEKMDYFFVEFRDNATLLTRLDTHRPQEM